MKIKDKLAAAGITQDDAGPFRATAIDSGPLMEWVRKLCSDNRQQAMALNMAALDMPGRMVLNLQCIAMARHLGGMLAMAGTPDPDDRSGPMRPDMALPEGATLEDFAAALGETMRQNVLAGFWAIEQSRRDEGLPYPARVGPARPAACQGGEKEQPLPDWADGPAAGNA